tara:strand:+ start:450812 stop:451306 length:495 start_codon:yes stop_codon:yes gene_type:complete
MCELNSFSHIEIYAGYKTACHRPVKKDGKLLAASHEGYVRVGRVISGGKKIYTGAHRARFAATGQALLPTDVLDHLCRNRACCNPEHLEIVDNAENIRRGNQTKITLEQVGEIRMLVAEGMTQYKVALKYKLSQSHVSRVVRGEYWSDGPCVAWAKQKGGTQNL